MYLLWISTNAGVYFLLPSFLLQLHVQFSAFPAETECFCALLSNQCIHRRKLISRQQRRKSLDNRKE